MPIDDHDCDDDDYNRENVNMRSAELFSSTPDLTLKALLFDSRLANRLRSCLLFGFSTDFFYDIRALFLTLFIINL
jgi:hypothetical protein